MGASDPARLVLHLPSALQADAKNKPVCKTQQATHLFDAMPYIEKT